VRQFIITESASEFGFDREYIHTNHIVLSADRYPLVRLCSELDVTESYICTLPHIYVVYKWSESLYETPTLSSEQSFGFTVAHLDVRLADQHRLVTVNPDIHPQRGWKR
jgi:hypothetical protein